MPDGGHFAGAHAYPALVLNADFRPLSYFPLSIWSWQDAIKAVFLDRVSVLNEYDVEVHSPSLALRLPSVIALKEFISLKQILIIIFVFHWSSRNGRFWDLWRMNLHLFSNFIL